MLDEIAGANAAFKDFAASVASNPKILSPVAHKQILQLFELGPWSNMLTS